ncbi:TfoX domain protein [Roseibacterium elongatum DSM 19469]|uniref:TfoX domain protein n=1 Tax=Roseicyclus elongatus DSM 19469 TaxID=1294273 RepID=W8S5H3_9RHOB|nr:TfoX/Sxy family protein [Roseibacterium elongatum]AHM05457.1 TfoX domain protein [Roseibacterium elongatum DSM 19469]
MSDPLADDPVTAIRNIGPAQAEALARAGITTATQLRRIGAETAYARMVDTGTRPHFIAFYALVMALQGRPWNDCKGAEKTALRERFDALIATARNSGGADPDLERMLDRIGTGLRR